MAQATITYHLPEEQEDFNNAVHASDYKMVLWDLDQKLRSKIKYDDSLDEKSANAYQYARDMLRELISDYGVSLD